MAARQNIVVIMSDQHRADAMGCAGHPWVHTPHLDKLAGQGVRFTNAYCNNPMCVPSRATFLTGQTTNRLGVWSLSDTMRSDELTWPALLGAHGYETLISGRMHFWWPDKLHGFSRRLCGDTASRITETTYTHFESGPKRDKQLAHFHANFRLELKKGSTGVGDHQACRNDVEATAAAETYLAGRSQGDPPFALCIGYLAPHSPLRFPAEYFDRYRDMPVTLQQVDDQLPALLKTFVRESGFDEPLDEQTARDALRAYYAMTTFIDDQVGRVVAALEKAGELENTLILYTSDHGEMAGDRGLWFKNQLLEPSIRVPMLVRMPGRPRAGQTESSLVSLMDLFPTFADHAGCEPWPGAQGDSFLPLLREDYVLHQAAFRDRSIFIEYADFGTDQPSACIRWGDLKLIAARNYQPVLYDLGKEPGETIDRANDPAYGNQLARMQRELARHWDPQDTYQRVVFNQKRTEVWRTARMLEKQRQSKKK